MSNTVTEVGEFFNAWAIYRKVLMNNYMHHQEIYQAVKDLLAEQWQSCMVFIDKLGTIDLFFR